MTSKTQQFLELTGMHIVFLLIFWGGIIASPKFFDVCEGMGGELTWAGELMFNCAPIPYALGFASALSLMVLFCSYVKHRSVSKVSTVFSRFLLIATVAYAVLFFYAMWFGMDIPYRSATWD